MAYVNHQRYRDPKMKTTECFFVSKKSDRHLVGISPTNPKLGLGFRLSLVLLGCTECDLCSRRSHGDLNLRGQECNTTGLLLRSTFRCC